MGAMTSEITGDSTIGSTIPTNIKETSKLDIIRPLSQKYTGYRWFPLIDNHLMRKLCRRHEFLPMH